MSTRLGLSLLFTLSLPDVARAHDPGLSSLELLLSDARVAARVTLARADAEPFLVDPSAPVIELEVDGRIVEPLARVVTTESGGSGADGVVVELTFPGVAVGRLWIRSVVFDRLARGHRQYATVVDERGNVLKEALLHAASASVTWSVEVTDRGDAAPAEPRAAFGSFVLLGIEHVILGYDHVLFLLALLVVAREWRSVLALVTSFTVAHSVTLSLSALGVVRVPASIVEPFIAASIVWVGLENLLRRGPMRHRVLLTFAFGLVHGMGFAAALAETGGRNLDSKASLLFGFNLGVEVGQLAIVATVLPLLAAMARTPRWAARVAVATSIAVSIAGAFWLIERTIPI